MVTEIISKTEIKVSKILKLVIKNSFNFDIDKSWKKCDLTLFCSTAMYSAMHGRNDKGITGNRKSCSVWIIYLGFFLTNYLGKIIN